MAKHKSPGQKRKKIVQIIVLLIFIAVTYAGSFVFNSVTFATISWWFLVHSKVAVLTNLNTNIILNSLIIRMKIIINQMEKIQFNRE